MPSTTRPLRDATIRAACRLFPFYSGYVRTLESPLIQALLPSERPSEIVKAPLCNGMLAFTRLDDDDGRTLYYLGNWDRRITWIFQRLLRPGDTVIDVGANYGLLSLIAAGLVGPSGAVHAFEPQPRLASLVRESAALNGLSQLHVHELALSETDGAFELYVPSTHSGGSSLVFREDGDPARTLTVTVRNTSDYFDEISLGDVRLLKVDVEGHEGAVLQGAERFVTAHPPAAVLFESMDRFRRPTPEGGEPPFHELPTVRFLREHDYSLFAIGRSYLRVRIEPIAPDQHIHPECSDLLALHARHRDDLARRLNIRG